MSAVAEAHTRATMLNEGMDSEVDRIILDEPRRVITRVRAFLLEFEQEEQANNVVKLVRSTTNHDVTEIVLGPQIDKGPTDTHFRFDSGARLSFGITLRQERKRSILLSYRFHFVFKDGHSPAFIRFDLNPDGSRPALEESRCHLHPGLDDTRLPARVLSPYEVLDRIFLVLDECSCVSCS